MRTFINSSHQQDVHGNPAGGRAHSTGLDIQWQNGPLGRGVDRHTPNGTFVEDVILAALDRLQFYQRASEGKFSCRQNALAITKLEEALFWLHDRTEEREARGVEGTHEV